MPKIDVTKEVRDLEGNPIFGPPGAPVEIDGEPTPPQKMTVRSACIQALLTADERDSGTQKFEAFRLAQKIQEDDNPHFKSEEIARLKKAVGKIFIPVVVGRVWDYLDPPKDELHAETSKDAATPSPEPEPETETETK